jgi:hypothetical protein
MINVWKALKMRGGCAVTTVAVKLRFEIHSSEALPRSSLKLLLPAPKLANQIPVRCECFLGTMHLHPVENFCFGSAWLELI